jgi:hypothetical protein
MRFVQDLMEGCSETASQITEIFFTLKRMLDDASVENAVATTNDVRLAWNLLVGEGRPYQQGQETQLAALFLYDLLRAYCKQSVKLFMDMGTFKVPVSKAKAMQMIASGHGSDIDFDGLDAAKRTVMYDKFADITKWGRRPKITKQTGWKDLIKNWDFAN